MVARIVKASSLTRSLNYNEQKVQQKCAELIHAENYPKDLEHLSFHDRLHRLKHQASLNQRVTANSVHISLNFDPAEKLDKELLRAISQSYMEQIGFGDQPYLVYQHHDAGHPHVHILTTNITGEGKRIDMNNIGRTLSEKARQNIDREFKLISPENKKLQQAVIQKQMDETWSWNDLRLPKVRYGKTPTKAAVQKVVAYVMNEYKYTSLPEFNAVLRLYNIVADRGEKESLMYKNGGLVYRVLDDEGNKIGTPIKASEFYNKPTLKNLEKKFSVNEELRIPRARHIKLQVDWAINRHANLANVIADLHKESISVLARQNSEGRIYGMTYIDLKNHVVFNGSDLGKEYSANAIMERCGINREKQIIKTFIKKTRQATISSQIDKNDQKSISDNLEISESKILPKLLEDLMRTDLCISGSPHELLDEQKKKKKRRLGHRL